MKTKLILIFLFFCAGHFFAQQTQVSIYQQRFDNYLNFKGALSPFVKIDQSGVKIFKDALSKKNDSPELLIYWEETATFINLVKTAGMDTLEAVMCRKGKNKWKEAELKRYGQNSKNIPSYTEQAPFTGKKIVIDPGHIAGNMDMARIEQKFLHFSKKNYPGLTADSIDIAEGILTYQTASILKKLLEEKGAEVFLSRGNNESTFGMTYADWLQKRKKIVLDSLKNTGDLNATRYSSLMKDKDQQFFWDFFRDYELAQRVKKINSFQPDITIIIHYNVDEKNTDWVKPSAANYTMAFIGGGMTADVFKNLKGKINFLRLLLSEDLAGSEKLSALTVQQFNTSLHIPIAKQADALYLKDNCLSTASAGVFCRNLALCRGINSVLVYGECLFQDNVNEYPVLSKQDKNYFGIQTNERVYAVAQAYYKALLNYFSK